MCAYDFAGNQVPGIKFYEESGYWRDVGNIESYYAAHRDLPGLKPRRDLFNPRWPIHSRGYEGPATRIIGGNVENSIISAGTVINGASVKNSILRREVYLEEGVELEDCIVMDYVRIKRGSRLRRVIVDRYNKVGARTSIGIDPEMDRARYHVSPSGIVVVPSGPSGPSGRRTHSFAGGYV